MQSPAFSIEGLLADISNVSVDGGVQACMLGIQGKCHHHNYINFLHVVAGISLVYTLNRFSASTDPCGKPFFCFLHELLMSLT